MTRKIGFFLVFAITFITVVVNPVDALVTVTLEDIDSGTTSPTGQYRWLDVADQPYAARYRESYNYTQANVQIEHSTDSTALYGTLTATYLKPNFAYQLKLVGTPDTACNESIGLTGRWWQEKWDGTAWADGNNLNTKGDGSSPNPNDEDYFERRDMEDLNSPTGKKYRYTAYLVFDYFITDSNGNATLEFRDNSSYHVLFKTSQRTPESGDGPLKTASFEVILSHFAYDASYPETEVIIYGEWERLPVGGVTLPEGEYEASFILTEESFHGSGGTYAGCWAAAMGGPAEFNIAQCYVDFSGFAKFAYQWLNIGCSGPFWCSGADLNATTEVDQFDLELFTDEWLYPCPNDWPLK